jgi:hypothetical protein
MFRRHVGTVVTAVVLFGFLGWALWFMITVWTRTDATLSGHGWAALILGVVFSCLDGFGQMGLIFFSKRRGYYEPPTDKRNDPS